MWVFSELADEFDRVRVEGGENLDGVLQPWVASTLQQDSPWLRNAAVYAGAGFTYGFYHLTTHVTASFLDVLRVGDGVFKKGGWGYAEDALRLLVLAGPVSRVARVGLSRLANLDVLQAANNCTWVAATRALRMTGVRRGATLADLSRAAGLNSIHETGGAFAKQLGELAQWLGARVRMVDSVSHLDDVAEIVSSNPNASTLFSITWKISGKAVGHTLVAFRDVLGRLRFLDRTGKVVAKIADLESIYPNIKTATVYGSTASIYNSYLVEAVEQLPILGKVLVGPPAPPKALLADRILLEVRSVPLRAPKRTESGAKDAPKVPGTYTVTTSKECSVPSGEGTPVCLTGTTKSYSVGTGDSLASIAQKVYRNASEWPRIYAANKHSIGGNPNVLRVGTVLIIP